ncbi:hypothetical protein D3C80_1180380 [compost metagenome]
MHCVIVLKLKYTDMRIIKRRLIGWILIGWYIRHYRVHRGTKHILNGFNRCPKVVVIPIVN